MIHAALVIWYALTALCGPYLCCWIRCEAPASAAVIAAEPAAKVCSHCCEEAETPAAPAPGGPRTPQPDCPYCQELILAAQSVVPPASASMGDLLDHPSNVPVADLLPAAIAEDAAVRSQNYEPPAPFPTAYDLIHVFHFMRC